MYTLIVVLVAILATVALAWLEMWIAIVVPIIIAIAMLAVRFMAAENEKETCYVPTGEIKLVVAGMSFVEAIPNLSGTGFYLDQETGNIVLGDEEDFDHPTSFNGIYLTSLLYPLRQLHVWQIDYGDEEPPTGKDKYTSSLPLLHTCKILIEGVELADGAKINILANVTFRITNPVLAVFIHGGKFITLGIASVKGVVADFGRDKTYEKFSGLDKEGEDSKFSMYVKKINDDVGGMAGLEKAYGIVVHKAEFESFSLVEASPEEQAALSAVRVATSNAEALMVTSKGKANAAVEEAREINTIGKAHAQALDARLEAAAKYPGGMGILQQEVVTDGIKGFSSPGALSLGGGGLPFPVALSKQTTH